MSLSFQGRLGRVSLNFLSGGNASFDRLLGIPNDCFTPCRLFTTVFLNQKMSGYYIEICRRAFKISEFDVGRWEEVFGISSRDKIPEIVILFFENSTLYKYQVNTCKIPTTELRFVFI